MIHSGMKAFITGGSGFIGSRLAAVLVDQLKTEVSVLVHRVSAGALRVAGKGVSLNFTSLLDEKGLSEALAGHDVVYHLAFGKFGDDKERHDITVEGTRALVNAAIEQNVQSFVYVSTAAVYFKHSTGLVDESSDSGPWGWDYADEKFAAEEVVRDAIRNRGLNGVIVQVAGVYGPWGENFTVVPLTQMKTGKIVLPGFGKGLSNATYVDDVVQMLLLATKPQAIGQTYLVKGQGRYTRAEFFSYYEAMFSGSRLALMSTDDAARGAAGTTDWRALGQIPRQVFNALKSSEELKDSVRKTPLVHLARRLATRIRGQGRSIAVTAPDTQLAESLPLLYPSPLLTDYLAAELEFSTKKAEQELGYRAVYSLDEGMALTKAWAQWARLLPN